MDFLKQTIPGLLLIQPKSFGDERGYFAEMFRQDLFDAAVGHHVRFIQDNESKSSKGVLRGLHYQLPPFAQSKLVRVLDGEVLDVAVDIRLDSPTFGKHLAVKLTGENKKQLFMPQGFAHGFIVLSDSAVFSYKVDNYYSPENDCGIAAHDTDLNIDWELAVKEQILSEKDMQLPSFLELQSPF